MILKQDVVVGLAIEGRIKVDEVYARIWNVLVQDLQIITVIQPVRCYRVLRHAALLFSDSILAEVSTSNPPAILPSDTVIMVDMPRRYAMLSYCR